MKRTVQWLAATMTLVLPLLGSHGHVAGSADSVPLRYSASRLKVAFFADTRFASDCASWSYG